MPHRFQNWCTQQHIGTLFGVGGVDETDTAAAQIAWRIFIAAMLIVAFWLLIQWQIESVASVPAYHRLVASVVVWGFFVLQLFVMLLLTNQRSRYLRHNWMIMIAIVLGIFYIIFYHVDHIWWLRNLQPILAMCILVPSGRMLLRFFADGRLSTTLFASCIIIIVFGLLVAGIDPNIKSPWDGIWWAIATVSTVGYGDVVPTSAIGRLLGAGLIILGLGIFVIITANFLAIILKRDRKESEHPPLNLDAINEDLQTLKQNQETIMQQLEKLQTDIDNKS